MDRQKEIKRLEAKCYSYSNRLRKALEQLAKAASEILGYEVIADICNGEEIEFREVGYGDIPDDFSCIRMEEVIDRLNSM